MTPEGPVDSNDHGLGLRPDQSVGITIGIVAVIFLLLFFCCYLKNGICFLCPRPIERRNRDASQDRKSSQHKDPEMQRHSSETQHAQPQHLASEMLPIMPSTTSSSHLYVDSKTELPVPDGPRHEIEGVGRSATTAQNRVEVDGAPVGPAELPAEHAATRQSWRTSASTLFQYTPRPSYVLSEEEEGRQDPEAARPVRQMGC